MALPLPSPSVGTTFERALQITRYPAAVIIAFLRCHQLAVDKAGVGFGGVEANVVLNIGEFPIRLRVTPADVSNYLISQHPIKIPRETFPLAIGAPCVSDAGIAVECLAAGSNKSAGARFPRCESRAWSRLALLS